jgi:hypothetical protein
MLVPPASPAASAGTMSISDGFRGQAAGNRQVTALFLRVLLNAHGQRHCVAAAHRNPKLLQYYQVTGVRVFNVPALRVDLKVAPPSGYSRQYVVLCVICIM